METPCSINVSQTYKTILWLWSKTGTSLASKIFSDFEFDSYEVKNRNLVFHQKGITQFHSCCFFDNHNDYDLITTIRNPYSRFFSEFRHNRIDIPTKDEFRIFLENEIYKKKNYDCFSFLERKPTYPLRIEKLYQDYSSIPFLKNSQIYQSGKLKEICEKKVNQNRNPLSWRDFYDRNLADLVYYSCQNYFEIFDYDRNSWKK